MTFVLFPLCVPSYCGAVRSPWFPSAAPTGREKGSSGEMADFRSGPEKLQKANLGLLFGWGSKGQLREGGGLSQDTGASKKGPHWSDPAV